MPDTPKTTDQLRAIFGLGKKLGMDKSDLEELAHDRTGGRVERLSLLSFDEANAMITHLGGDAFPAAVGTHVAARTLNYRRQKAGVKQVESQRHLKMIDDLAAKRNMSAAGLASLCMRIIKRPAPATTAQGNKIIEALKAMNARDQGQRSKVKGQRSATAVTTGGR